MGIALKGKGMHDFVLRELEVGFRVAVAEDDERCGWGPLLDAMYLEYVLNQEFAEQQRALHSPRREPEAPRTLHIEEHHF